MINQLVILSARKHNIRKILPCVIGKMPFIKKILFCCPEEIIEDDIQRAENGIAVEIISDKNLLNGRDLPTDHGTRNFLLRCLLMRRPETDDVFIMSDDDYYPLYEISEDFFIRNGKYNCYYCGDLCEWSGTCVPTSYANYIFRTRDFCIENGFPTLQYSSHMPQVIDKRIYCEMLDEFLGLENQGLDEWSSYFNYAIFHHPELFCNNRYETLGWPSYPGAFRTAVIPEKYSFENYYDYLYYPGEIYDELINDVADKKIDRYTFERDRVVSSQNKIDDYQRKNGFFKVYRTDDGYSLETLEGIPIDINTPLWIKVLFSSDLKSEDEFTIGYRVLRTNGKLLSIYKNTVIVGNRQSVNIPITIRLEEQREHQILWFISSEKEENGGRFLLPYERIKPTDRIVIYGAGSVGRDYAAQLEENKYGRIIEWVDSNVAAQNDKVHDPCALSIIQYDVILIAVADYGIAYNIFKMLLDMGVHQNKIIWQNPDLREKNPNYIGNRK